jgi:membrane protein DedA with SNARE-associated domain
MVELIQACIAWYMSHINYWTICLLMTIESSFIPFPSEVVVPPAAWKAAEGSLSMVGVLGASTLGALLGALINYALSLTLGRAVIYKFAETRLAHALLIRKKGLEKAEEVFRKNGAITTFVGRLVPALRQLISIPAGLARMDLKVFVLFTSLGAFLWNATLAALGFFLYSQKDVLHRYYETLSIAFAILGILFFAYLIYQGVRRKKTVHKGV